MLKKYIFTRLFFINELYVDINDFTNKRTDRKTNQYKKDRENRFIIPNSGTTLKIYLPFTSMTVNNTN